MCFGMDQRTTTIITREESSYLCLSDHEKPRHSTPRKSNGIVQEGGYQVLSSDSRYEKCRHLSTEPDGVQLLQDTQLHFNPRNAASTIQKLKKELQLLVTELKDRDNELNTMAAAHRQEVQTWEKTRQKLLKLERKCACLEDELMKRNDVIRILTKHVVVMETSEEEMQEQLRKTQQQLKDLSHKEVHLSKKNKDFEEQNESLNASVTALSTQIGALQVREEELSSMLKLKEKDVIETSTQLLRLTDQLEDLEKSLKESYTKESTLQTELHEKIHYCAEARCSITQFKEQLQQQIAQSNIQREEIIRLKQELHLLNCTQASQDEGERSWKDELLELSRSKQERTMSELMCLRQVCENQRNDIQLLQLNLESAHQSLKERVSLETPNSQYYVNRRLMDLDLDGSSDFSLKKILEELDETSSEDDHNEPSRHHPH